MKNVSAEQQRYLSLNLQIILPFLALLTKICSFPIDNGLVDSELIKECASNNTVDVLLLLDGSGSVGDDTFRMQLQFAALLARRLNISSDGTHLALIQFAELPQLEITLNQYNCESQLEWAIQRVRYLGGATNTGQALNFALENGFQNARGGPVPKVVVVVTDGQSQDEVEEAAQRLHDAQVMVYAIGVTNLVNVRQLHQITGDALRVHTVEAFDQLDKSLADSITWHMCRTDFRPGTPDIICEPDKIGVRATTKKQFEGTVFVQDNYHRAECRAGPEHFPDPNVIGITVPFTNCNVRRYRSLNPRGIFVETTVVFMFHPVFMTKVDQMVKIQCFYMEAEKQVNVPMEVSQITTQFYQKVYQMPRCEYTLRKDHQNGPIVQYAVLGQSVFHRWECVEELNGDLFGMLVHSCFVDNGFGDRVDILDAHGCGLDAVLLHTPDYDSTLRLATKEYHVFKYADRPVLQFQCQITLCLKLDGGCLGITPPKCAETMPRHIVTEQYIRRRKSKKQRKARTVRAWNSVGEAEEVRATTMDVFTRPIIIVENEQQQFANKHNANNILASNSNGTPAIYSTLFFAEAEMGGGLLFHDGIVLVENAPEACHVGSKKKRRGKI
uniref:ZP domain-containing protein n=1 Tax=Globodera pallida TaxID=36090 RepID=A0A183CA49_GLOPA